MRPIVLLTNVGDAPRMNAAIRAVVRTGLYRGLEIVGARPGMPVSLPVSLFSCRSKT